MTRLVTDLDRILASVPVNRLAMRVTAQPDEREPIRDEVPAPTVSRVVTVTTSGPSRRAYLKRRIQELERDIRAAKGLPKARRRELGAEKHACQVELCQLRMS